VPMNIELMHSIEWLKPRRATSYPHRQGCIALLFTLLMAAGLPSWSDAAATISTQKTVSLVTSKFPPYKDPELPDNGLLVAITRAALEKVGYELTITYRPWARILVEIKSGSYDGILGVWYREQRQAWLAYSQPIGVNRVVLFKHTGLAFKFNGFDSLKPYTIGVVRGYATTPGFIAANLNVEDVTSDEQNVDKLVNRRIDFTLMDDLVMHNLLKKKYPDLDVIEEVGLVVEREETFVGFSKDAVGFTQKLIDFNIGLKEIRQDGTFSRIMKKYHAMENP